MKLELVNWSWKKDKACQLLCAATILLHKRSGVESRFSEEALKLSVVIGGEQNSKQCVIFTHRVAINPLKSQLQWNQGGASQACQLFKARHHSDSASTSFSTIDQNVIKAGGFSHSWHTFWSTLLMNHLDTSISPCFENAHCTCARAVAAPN